MAPPLMGKHTHGPIAPRLTVLVVFTSTIIGALVGNPADLTLVRMQADGRLPHNQRRNYRHAGDAVYRIAREEGSS